MSDLWGKDNLFDSPGRRGDPFGFQGREDDIFRSQPSSRQSLESKILEAEAMAKAYKIKVPDQPNKKLRLWDLLEWARYPITNMIYTAARESKEDGLAFNDIGKILKSAWYGVTLKERHNTEDYLRILFPKAPEWVIKVAGLAGDIVTDPTTWLSFGSKGGIKAAAELGQRGAAWSGKAIKRIAKEGASGAFATKLIEKYGGKTWMEAVSLAKRAQIREVGEFGLRLGLPFGGPSVKLAAGGPLDWATGAAKAAGATKLAGGLQRLPVAIQQLPIISGIRKAFSPQAKFGLLPEAHQIERKAMREASFRIETTMSNFRVFEKSVDDLLATRAAKFGTGPKGRNAILEAVWNHNELVAAGKKGIKQLPADIADVDTQLRQILDDIWQGMETRGMTTKAPKLPAYYPRFYKDQAGNLGMLRKKKFSTDAPFLHLRQFDTRAQAAAHGFKAVDPLESLQMYAHRSSRAIQNHDLVEEMVKQYGVPVKGGLTEGFERLTVPGFEKFGAPSEVASVLNQTQKILMDPDELAQAGKYLNKVQNWWKRWATIYNPGFHMRNAASNVWTGAFKDGIGPRQLANQLKATVIHTWRQHPDKLVSVTIDGKKVKKTAKELYELLRKAGVHTGGFAAADLGEAAIKQTVSALEKAGGAAGGFVENTARVASALNDLDKGLDLASAAKRVNFYFLDYGDLTPVEEKLRKLIPFYSWLKKNLAVQMHEFVTNPGKYTAWTTKPLRALDTLPEDQAQYLPDWMREDLYINPLGAKGAFGSPLMLNPNLPFQDLGRLGVDLAHPLSKGGPIGAAAGTIMEGLSPFLKVPFEVMLNRSGFTGQPLQYSDYDYRPAPPLIRLTVGNLPPRVKDALGVKEDADGNMLLPGKWVYALSALLPMLKTGGGAERYIQAMTGAGMPEYRAERAPWDLLSRVGGVKFRPFDVGYYKEKQLLERLKQLKGLTSLTGDGL